MTRRGEHPPLPDIPPVEAEAVPRAHSDPPLTIRYGRSAVTVEGLRAGVTALLVAYGGLVWRGGSDLIGKLDAAGKSLDHAAAAFAEVSADAREAKAAAVRAEQGLEGLRGEVAGVRRDVADLRRDFGGCTLKPR